jgi:hypothetical protein
MTTVRAMGRGVTSPSVRLPLRSGVDSNRSRISTPTFALGALIFTLPCVCARCGAVPLPRQRREPGGAVRPRRAGGGGGRGLVGDYNFDFLVVEHGETA